MLAANRRNRSLPHPADSAGTPAPATQLNTARPAEQSRTYHRLASRKLSTGAAANTGKGKRGDGQEPCAAATFKVGTGRFTAGRCSGGARFHSYLRALRAGLSGPFCCGRQLSACSQVGEGHWEQVPKSRHRLGCRSTGPGRMLPPIGVRPAITCPSRNPAGVPFRSPNPGVALPGIHEWHDDAGVVVDCDWGGRCFAGAGRRRLRVARQPSFAFVEDQPTLGALPGVRCRLRGGRR
jgi:hypothetical protein